MKSEIKNIFRKYLPASVFSYLYIKYAEITGLEIDKSKIKRYADFNREGLYDFHLDDQSFKIKLNPENGGVDAEIFADGHYEGEMLRLIKNNLKGDDVFMDIGANIGQHSLYASRYAKRVYSFEPIKSLYEQFSQSIFANDFLNIRVFNYALGNQKSTMPIYGSSANMGGSTIVTSENRNKIQDIKVIKLDDVFEEMSIERCDLIKIDVEGYELDVLLGAESFIKRYKPKLIIEYSPIFYRKVGDGIGQSIYDYLKANNYKVFNLDSILDDRVVKSFDDLRYLDQANIFCVRDDI